MRVYSVSVQCPACGVAVADAVVGSMSEMDVRTIECPGCGHKPMTVIGPVRSRPADEIDMEVLGRRVPYTPGDLD